MEGPTLWSGRQRCLTFDKGKVVGGFTDNGGINHVEIIIEIDTKWSVDRELDSRHWMQRLRKQERKKKRGKRDAMIKIKDPVFLSQSLEMPI